MLFARFMVIYGHKFKSSFETDQELSIAKREWARSIAAYDEDVLLVAIEEAKQRYSWMPSIAEFLQLLDTCQHQFGLPSCMEAYTEACMFADKVLAHHWQHAIVYHAGKKTGWYELRTCEREQIYALFADNYRSLCQRILAGETLPMPPQLQLPDVSSAPLFTWIKAWGNKQGLSEEQAQTMLYYLHLSLRNPERSKLQKKYHHQYPNLWFPNSAEELEQCLAK